MLEQNNSQKNKRIAKNTFILYFRMLFLMLVSLYTSRVILDALGVSDYGIYNVVGGFVSMFGLISAALTSACSRFLNFEMGKGDITRQNVVFSTAVTIQWALAIIVFLLAEIIGVWYVNNVMVIPQERLIAANWCFQFSVFNFCMNIVTVPYNASIIAHERMKAFAYVSIYQGLATLAISFAVNFEPFDRLVYYALLLLCVQLCVLSAYQIYCRRHFFECHYHRVFDKPLLKKMLSYSVWHLVGNGAAVLKTHGVNIVLNLFYGPTVNAAKGLTNQVDSAVNQFVGNYMMAMNPQITQSYAKGDLKYMFQLVNKGSRLSFFLILILSLPIFFNTHYILGLWLKKVPDYTVVFTQLTLVITLLSSLSKTLIMAQNATGNVRNYQLIVGGISLLNLPFSYLCLYLGGKPEVVLFVAICIEILALGARVFMLPFTISSFNIILYLKGVGLRCLFVCLIVFPIPYYLHRMMSENFVSFIINVLACLIISVITVWYIGCNKGERDMIYSNVGKFKKRIFK